MNLELVDEILDYVDRQFPEPSLKYTDPDADAATADLFRSFCFFIKEVNKDPKVGSSTVSQRGRSAARRSVRSGNRSVLVVPCFNRAVLEAQVFAP